MGQLFDTIRQLASEEKYVVGQHASKRLAERSIMEWQVIAGLEDGEMIAERPDATPSSYHSSHYSIQIPTPKG